MAKPRVNLGETMNDGDSRRHVFWETFNISHYLSISNEYSILKVFCLTVTLKEQISATSILQRKRLGLRNLDTQNHTIIHGRIDMTLGLITPSPVFSYCITAAFG